MSENRNKKIFAGSMAAVLLLGASSLAWFTDRTEGNITGQAGSLCIEMTDIEANLDHLAPGDKEDIKFEYRNTGSLAMDTRITYALSYELNDEVSEALADEIDSLDVIARIDGVELKADGEGIARGTVEGGVLNGTQEVIEEGLDEITKALSFEFDESVGNIGQLMTFELKVIIEGKQDRHNPDWTDLATTTITFGEQEMEVVKEAHCQVIDGEDFEGETDGEGETDYDDERETETDGEPEDPEVGDPAEDE